jgi:hypothetical protein
LEKIMGSTVTTGRMAAAFRAQSGAIIYCLYEQTYEKNCFPHTPHWSAIYIGPITGALQTIFSYASSCEGGMLQNRSGWMTPEGYLRNWMSELRSPLRMTRDHTISLYVKTDSLYAPLSTESLPAVAATLAIAGIRDAEHRLVAGEKVTLSLFEHGDLISQLHGDHKISAWRLLADYSRPPADAERAPSLGIATTITKMEAHNHEPALIVSTHGDTILRDTGGTWRCHGKCYEIMATYIQTLAPVEQVYPGSYHHLIRSRREHLKGAPKAHPSQLIVQIDRRLAADKWDLRRIEEAAAFPNATWDGDIITIPFIVEHDYALTNLPRAATTWRLLSEDRLPLETVSKPQSSLL